MDRNETYITIGKLGRTRGVRGDIWVTVFSDFPERFLDLKEVYVGDRGTWQKRKLESAQMISTPPL